MAKGKNNMALVTTNNNRAIKSMVNEAAILGANLALSNAGPIANAAMQVGKGIYAYSKQKKGNNTTTTVGKVTNAGALGGAIVAPVAVTRQIRGVKPKFSGRSSGGVTVSHREYLGEVVTTTALQVNAGITGNLLKINPLNGILFTWLPSLAAGYDQYAFNSISLHYVPVCSTGATGRVALYWDKDSTDPEPTDRVELANQYTLKETAPWAEATLNIPVDRKKRFCDDSSVVDRKLIDAGQLGVATYGGPATPIIAGDVFISYSVTLYSPQPLATLMQTTTLGPLSAIISSVGPSYTVTSYTPTLLTIAFRAVGKFAVVGSLRGTGAPALGTVGNVSVTSSTILTTGSGFMYLINVTVSSVPASLTLAATTITGLTSSVVRVTRNNDMNTP